MTVKKSLPEAQAPTSSRQVEKRVRRFDRMLRRSGDLLPDRFGEETAAVMREEMLEEYRRLIPEVPYIGGRRNLWADTLALAPWGLAAYRVMIRHGGNLEDTGELVHWMMRGWMQGIPKFVRDWIGRQRFGRLRRRKVEKAARRSQDRRYPEDFVFERIDGDGKTFDFGIDITECAGVKYLHAQEADELCPYLCDLDYVMFEAMGIGLQRTKTLAWGCDRCDFRLSKHGTTTAPWPPEFVERTCGQPQP